MTSRKKTTLAFTKDSAGVRHCGPYRIDKELYPSGNHKHFRAFYQDTQLGHSYRLDGALSAAEAHWAHNGCPALEEAMSADSPVTEESDSDALQRIKRNFRVMNRLVNKVVKGKYPSLIITGPGGVGKSFPTKKALTDCGKTVLEVSGKMTAPGLFSALWQTKDNGILLLDDCDSVFEDNNAINLLKAALDSNARRRISWMARASWIEDEGMENTFDFKGSVIFISNIDFDKEIARGTKRSAHLEALLSRSVHLDLDIRSTRDLLLRIQDMVLENGMVDNIDITDNERRELVQFMTDNADKFRSLTLREAVKLAKMIAADDSSDKSEWRDEASATLARGRRI